MSFFDDKEEVLNIELTQYGKHLLSEGRFKPAFYTFHDEDILYDSSYGLLTEKQNDTEQRILNQTPALKPSYVFNSVDKDTQDNKGYSLYSLRKQKESIKNLLPNPLGKSSYNSSYYPAFNIISRKNAIKEKKPYENYEADKKPFLFKIPQITMDINNIKIIAFKQNDTKKGCRFMKNLNGYSVYNDGINYEFFDIKEKNCFFEEENFEIEVFIEDHEDSTTEETKNNTKYWRKLYFKNKQNNSLKYLIKNNILYDSDEINFETVNNLMPLENYVETFLNISFDDAAENRNKILENQCPDKSKTGKGNGQKKTPTKENTLVDYCK